MATAEFSKFAGILSAALSQYHLFGYEIAQLEFHHLHSQGREKQQRQSISSLLQKVWASSRVFQILFIYLQSTFPWGFPGGSDGKESACNAGDWVLSLGWEDLLEKGKATHSDILAWRIPWTV